MSSIDVRKRDGSVEDFDVEKLSDSIMNAALAVGGEDYDLADEIANSILDILESNGIEEIATEDLQNIVEKTLIEDGHAATAKEYILKAADRNRMREMDTALMKSFEEITFKSEEDSEIKRENANIDSSTSMGTMLKYGSEGAKNFNLLYMMSEDIAAAHKNCDIHIHDLDFWALTETCVSYDTLLCIKINGVEKVVTASELYKIVGGSDIDKVIDTSKDDLYILSNGNYTKVRNMVAHSGDDKRVLRLKFPSGKLDVTDNHRVSVIRNGEALDIKASDINCGDVLDIPDINKNMFGETMLDIVETYTGDNLVIVNSLDVIRNVKELGNWKEFCNIFDYTNNRYSCIRKGHSRMTVKEFKMIEHLTDITHSELTLAYKRTRSDESINGVIPLTFELGNFIGLMYAEGSITEHAIIKQESNEKKACFCNYDENLINQFNNNAKTIFNNVSLTDRTHQGRLTGTHLSGYLAWELFHGVFGYKNSVNDIRLADWMYTANSKFVSGLLAGIIDGDGTVQKDGYRVVISSVSISMLRDIQQLLLFRGIESVIKHTEAYEGSIAKFNNDGVCTECIRNYTNYKLEFTGNLNKKLGWVDSNKINGVDIKESNKFPTKLRTVNSVKEIEYSDLVFDLETDDHHFTANGVNVHNCCQIPLDKLYDGGFNTGHGFLRQPGGIRTAAALAAIAIQSNQNDQHGGQSIPLLDYYLAPYVALSYVKHIAHVAKIKLDLTKDQEKSLKRILIAYQRANNLVINDYSRIDIINILKKWFEREEMKVPAKKISKILTDAEDDTYEETFQAMEAFIHNLNTMHSRAGAQVPFSSVNYGTDTSTEGRMVMRAILETTWDGLGNGETPIFPIQILKLKNGVNMQPEDPNYDIFKLACKVSAKRLYPNFCNLDAPYNAAVYKEGRIETEVATMGCRTRVATNKYDPDKAIIPGRGNLSFTSINLPRCAILAKGDIDVFYKLLDERLELVHKQLLERFEIQCNKHPINYPFLMGQGVWLGSEKLGPKDDIREILKHGTLGVGFIGLAETLVALTGKHHGESEEAQKLGLQIIQHMRDYTDAWSDNEHMNYSVIGTPAEGLSGRFIRAD